MSTVGAEIPEVSVYSEQAGMMSLQMSNMGYPNWQTIDPAVDPHVRALCYLSNASRLTTPQSLVQLPHPQPIASTA